MSDYFTFDIRVYYEDTDFSGNVYHGSYVKFFERSRTEWLRNLGIHHFELAKQGLAFAVAKMEIDFLKPSHIDDLINIKTRLISISGARISLEQEAFCRGKKIASAKLVIAVIDVKGRATRLPKDWKPLFLA